MVLLPPWTRAPFLPFRQPAVILAVLGAAAILACASSSGLLFLSSAGAETLHRMLAAQCADAGFPTVRATNVVADPARGVPATTLPVEPIAVDDREVRAAMRGLGLAEPSRVLVSDQVPQVTAGGTSSSGLLFYRDGATGQITQVGRRIPGAGVWLPEQTATSLGVRPGATVALSATGVHSSSARVRVVGVYRDLFAEPIRPYWCAYATLFLYSSTGNDAYPPQPVIATDVATFERLREGYGGSSTDRWVSAADLSGVTLSQGRSIAAEQHEAYRRLGLPEPQGLVERTTGTGRMPELARRAQLTRDGLRGPVLPIALGGSILALLLVGAAGSYWADRRSREVRLLSSRGVGPGALAVKAVLELALPAVVGTVLGWLAARWLVAVLGPSPRLDRSAPWQAGLVA
ncbi:MAG TPA: FtsX-like permease family protein, partial [Mycobacteriales bacterium]|nr:FtsX-like permease family protein [Mycobacteriales bacterium]